MSGVRRSRAEWQSLIERAQGSPLRVTAFCASQGVSTASFYLWRKRLGVATPAEQPREVGAEFLDLGALEVGPREGEGHRGGWDVELSLGGGVVLRLRRR